MHDSASPEFRDLAGPGKYAVRVAGTSRYQAALLALCGNQRSRAAKPRKVTAQLWREPNNPHDPHAVRVAIDGETVGYLPRDLAPVFNELTAGRGEVFRVKAMIVGGWKNERDEGTFGVRLDI